MQTTFIGRAWVFGDNINTDIISPPQYMELSIADAAPYCMMAVRPEFAGGIAPGDILVAGQNLGSGSSRETSPLTLRHLGIKVVVAQSFARIFYRNCINVGILAIRCADADKIRDGERLEVKPEDGLISCLDSGLTLKADPLPENLVALAEAGGLLPWLAASKGKNSRGRK